MVAPLLAGIVLGGAPTHDIAYVARYYYPYPDKRISREEVYVSDIHGKNRIQISRAKGKPRFVHWVSETVVAWSEVSGGKDQEYQYDILRRQRKAVKESPLTEYFYENQFLSRSDSPDKPAAYETSEDGDFTLAGEPSIPYPLPVEGTGETMIQRAGKTHRWKLFEGVFHFFKSRVPGKTWIVSGHVGASAGSTMFLYRADWKADSVALVAERGIDFQLTSDEGAWCALQGERPMSPYGPKKYLWTCQIRAAKVGGKEWIVTPGLVFTKEFKLRPKAVAADF